MRLKSDPERIYTLLILLAAAALLSAQPSDIKFDHIGLDQGLSQSTVTTIVQDARGFLWFGTQDGLNRYDGYSIKVYAHDPADSTSISDDGIWSLLSDSRGDLWIGTERGGLNRYVYSENRFYHYVNDPEDPSSLSDDYVLCLLEDRNQNIWIGTHEGGLNRFNRGSQTFTHFSLSSQDDPGASEINSVRSICQDKEGNIWIGTGRGLFKIAYDGLTSAKPQFIHYSHKVADPNSFNSDNINSLFFDGNGLLWIGTWGSGLTSFNPVSGSFHFIQNSTVFSHSLINSFLKNTSAEEQELWIGTYDGGLYLGNVENETFEKYLDDNILTLYEDKSGILWIGTFGNGVRILDRRKIKFVHHYNDSGKGGNLHNNNAIIGILQDKDGELWFAAIGNTLSRFDKHRKKITRYTLRAKNAAAGKVYICTLAESSDGSIWVGTVSGGIYRFDKKSGEFRQFRHEAKNRNSLLSDDVATLFYDKESNVMWIGYLQGGISSFDPSKNVFGHFYPDDKNPGSIPNGLITTIYAGKESGLWVGIADKGVFNFHKQGSRFSVIKKLAVEQPAFKSHNDTHISSNYIFSIYEDKNGIIWMGSKGSGLIRYDPSVQSFKNYTVANGLPNDVVYGIEPDKNGMFWLSTNKGLSRFDPATGQFRNFDKKDGLQSNEFSEQAHFAGPDGELFFGGVNGFNSFYPEEIEDNAYVPPVYLTNFKVFNETLIMPDPLPSEKPIELSYSQNFFTFEFVALNYSLPEKNRYAYMLQGFDRDWHYVSAAQRQASYTNLDPGEYILRVKGSNNDGIWNETGTSIKIIVKPPFWMTLWFQLPLGLFIVMILILIYRYRIKKLLEVERIRSSIALDLHDDIGTTLTEIALYSDVSLRELNSESVHNALNGGFVKLEKLLESIGKTSRMLIDAMNDIVWAVDPKNDSFESFLLRIKTQTAQMLGAKGIDYRIDIQDRVSNIHLPLMHRRQLHLIFREALNNVIKHARAKKVELKMRKEGQSLVLTIADDGIGLNDGPVKNGNGLNNMKKRAAFLKGNLEIESVMEGGTKIELTVDLN